MTATVTADDLYRWVRRTTPADAGGTHVAHLRMTDPALAELATQDDATLAPGGVLTVAGQPPVEWRLGR